LHVKLGKSEGCDVGKFVGSKDRVIDGKYDGFTERFIVGIGVGLRDGFPVGSVEGKSEGLSVGEIDELIEGGVDRTPDGTLDDAEEGIFNSCVGAKEGL